MNGDLVRLVGWGAVALIILIALAAYKKVLRLFGVVIVPEDSVGIVVKKFYGPDVHPPRAGRLPRE